MKLGDDIRILRRQRESDPFNPELRLRYHHAVARVYGESTLPLLYSRTDWVEADPVLQDAAIGAVSRRLGIHYELDNVGVFRCNGGRHRIATFIHRETEIPFMLIPGGGFRMGTSDLEVEMSYCERFIYDLVPNDYEDESPTRWITLKPFLMSRSMLLQKEWREIASSPNQNWRDPEQPCFGLSWLDGQRWLNMNDQGFRFPKEEEWEYACRAGSASRFFWGDDMDESYCWYSENSEAHPHSPEEHERRANSFGLIDMLGNVSEWCEDWDGEDQLFRVHRGGNYQETPPLCRAAWRDGQFPNEVDESLGMRVASSIPGL